MRAIFLKIGLILLLLLGVTGCATSTCTKDPSSAGYGCGDIRKAEIKRQHVKSEQLTQELEQTRRTLIRSESRLKNIRNKLASTAFKTQKSRDQAVKLAKELRDKEQELSQRKKDLSELEKKVANLKNRKMGKKEELARVTQAKNELIQKKKEISVLTNYLKEDLFLRAENALLYD